MDRKGKQWNKKNNPSEQQAGTSQSLPQADSQQQQGGRGRGRGRQSQPHQQQQHVGSSRQDFPGLPTREPAAQPQAEGQRAWRANPVQGFQAVSQQQQPHRQVQQQQQPHRQVQQQQQPHRQVQQQLPQKVSPTKSSDDQQIAEELSQLSIQEQQPSSVSSTAKSPSSDDQTKREKQAKYAHMYAQIPKRKDPQIAGTQGRKIEVLTNMMEIKFGKNFSSKWIHYDVDIQPNVPKYLMRPVFQEAKKILFPERFPAFDGKKNAFSVGYLPFGRESQTIDVTVPNEEGREKPFKVTIKFANEMDPSWFRQVKPGIEDDEKSQIALQALDVILRSAPALRATPVGRSFFSPPAGQVISLGGGMDLWIGLFQSAVLGWKLYLNVDVAHKGFPKPQNVLDLCKTICGCDEEQGGGYGGGGGFGGRGGRGGGRGGYQGGGRGGYQGGGRGGYQGRGGGQGGGPPPELTSELVNEKRDVISKFLKGLKVKYEIPGQPIKRIYRVNDLVRSPRDDTFEHNGRKITVEKYYSLEKKYNIRHPTFPCLWVGPRDKNIHVPLELCTIVGGQATQKKLDEKQTSTMIRQAATNTHDRKRKIEDSFKFMNHNQDPCMREFGISVSGQFDQIPARVLNPPTLEYQRKCNVAKGVWRVDKFIQPSNLIANDGSWTILNLDTRSVRDDRPLYDLQDQIIKIAQTKNGMNIGKALTPFEHKRHDFRDLQNFFDNPKIKALKLVVVVIPEIKGPYSRVKQMAELKTGVLTQCLKSKTVLRNLKDSTLENILLKINAKLNGINHVLGNPTIISQPSCLQHPCMIVGADVTHPSPDSTDIPSIAAVAASHDPNAFKYKIEIRLQPPRQEIISDLAAIIRKQLIYFYKKTNGQKPSKIIYYRDGVGEGYFGEVMHEELKAIRNACLSLDKSYKPPITFLMVQKRHHIRLFPTDPRNSDDNVQAGTIVDTNITHPSHIDFYLVSHASIQGTARPTKYRCLWDDSNMSEDEIEQLTYFLCHMFTRCTRSVSYPAPTYYAHLAAFRARALIQDVQIKLNQLPSEQKDKLTIKDDILEGCPMFFV